ncbi:hypothetical protein WN943_022638 [Citrus x changshan-huyou]
MLEWRATNCGGQWKQRSRCRAADRVASLWIAMGLCRCIGPCQGCFAAVPSASQHQCLPCRVWLMPPAAAARVTTARAQTRTSLKLVGEEAICSKQWHSTMEFQGTLVPYLVAAAENRRTIQKVVSLKRRNVGIRGAAAEKRSGIEKVVSLKIQRESEW